MFYINNRFGIKSVFQNFLELERLRIPGEVQHGYWTEEKWISYIERRSRFTPMFLWGGELERALSKKTSQSVEFIGDPWFYIEIDLHPIHSSNNGKMKLIPSFDRQMKAKERFEKHEKFIRECRSIIDVEGLVSLHPAEPKSEEIKRLYEKNGFLLEENISISDPEFLVKKARSYLASQMILTDYIGPHLFRASTLNVQVILLERTPSKSNLEYKEILEIFGSDKIGVNDIVDKKLFSSIKLGFKNVRSRTELEKLFHTSSLQQKSLDILFHSKEMPLKLRNFVKTRSSLLTADPSNSEFQCPHCYAINKTRKSGVAICTYCWTRFRI